MMAFNLLFDAPREFGCLRNWEIKMKKEKFSKILDSFFFFSLSAGIWLKECWAGWWAGEVLVPALLWAAD